jgi:hypothetical protein
VVASLGLGVKGEDGARLLADLIGEHMCSRKHFTEKEMPDLRFSPLPRQDEEFLQNGPYIDAKKEGKKKKSKTEGPVLAFFFFELLVGLHFFLRVDLTPGARGACSQQF